MDLLDLPYFSYVAVLAITVLFLCYKLKSSRGSGEAAPEAGGAWPITGHLPSVRGESGSSCNIGGLG
ncbi:hypothetical protein DITRI_Ditri10aG0034400 [Diplodiscus trichospermus]